MKLSVAAQKEIIKSQSRSKFPYLIKITDTSNNSVYNFVNADSNYEWNNETFTAASFSVTPPERTNDKMGDGSISFSAVDTEWIRKIRQTQKRFLLQLVAVIDYTSDGGISAAEEIETIDFILTNASWTDESITWTMKFEETMDIMIPCDKMTELVCPGVV